MSEHFAVKRINSELKDQLKNPSPNFTAEPLENDLFDWHFTLRGPKDSPYENGIYHGRLILPLNYPLKPPKFLMFNHSGRFEVGREICMSNTSFHPDEWQPAWTIRTILEGLISFFPEETEGAVGALKASEETRRALAKNSWHWNCSLCGSLAEVWKNHMAKFPGLEFKMHGKHEEGKEEMKLQGGMENESLDKKGEKGEKENKGEKGDKSIEKNEKGEMEEEKNENLGDFKSSNEESKDRDEEIGKEGTHAQFGIHAHGRNGEEVIGNNDEASRQGGNGEGANTEARPGQPKLPSANEVKKFVEYVDRRVFVIESTIVLLLGYLIIVNFTGVF